MHLVPRLVMAIGFEGLLVVKYELRDCLGEWQPRCRATALQGALRSLWLCAEPDPHQITRLVTAR